MSAANTVPVRAITRGLGLQRPFLQPLRVFLAEEPLRKQLLRLFERTPGAHPVLHPDSLQAHFGSQDLDVFIAGVERDTVLCCAGILDPWLLSVARMPGTQLEWNRRGRRVYGKGLLWDGQDHSVSEWLQAIEYVMQRRAWAGLMVEALAVDSPLHQAIATARSTVADLWLFCPQPLQERWRVRLPERVDDYWMEQFNGKTRNTLFRKRRSFGNYVVDIVTEPDQIDAFLKAASAVSKHTWQTQQPGLRVRNDEQERRLYRSLAERHGFRGYLMRLDGRPAAFAINTCSDGWVYHEEIGYGPDVADKSPGMVLVSELLDDLIRCGCFHTLDFGLGHADYKQMFSNQWSNSCDVWLLRNSPANALATSVITVAERAGSTVRRVLDHTGLTEANQKTAT